jgi:hypothetical protein
MRLRTTALTLLTVIAMTGLTVKADFTPIALPDAAYTSSTILINIGGLPNSDLPPTPPNISSVTNGIQTVSFDQNVYKNVVGVDWSSWGSPPFTETNTPPILFQIASNTLQMFLSVPSTTFGFELQGANSVTSAFNVEFFEGNTPVGNVTLSVNGFAGARLFAGRTTDSPFTTVTITNTDRTAGGFAIANLRYTPVPEPASVAMIAQAIAAVGFYGWRKRRQAAK